MKITILTISPEELADLTSIHDVSRAMELGLLDLSVVDMRDYADGCFRRIDDSPFGGGRGLLLRCEPVIAALEAAKGTSADCAIDGVRSVALAPAGVFFTQQKAHAYAELSHLILICGHYEGFDARIYNHVDERLSIGPYVLSGGEIAARVVLDAVARLLPGTLKQGSAEEESFENEGKLEYLQYTRPADFRGEKVPEVLLSGHHGKIADWRQKSAEEETERFLSEGGEK